MARHHLTDFEPKIDALDQALLAYILAKAAPLQGRTKVQKTVFLIEVELQKHKLVGPSFRFFRYNNGPFSRELLDAQDLLAAHGHAYKSGLSLTSRGRFLAQLVEELKKEPENRKLFRVMDAVIRECQPQSGETLMNKVYQMKIRPEGWTADMKVEDVPVGTDLIVPPPNKTLVVPDDLAWLINQELKLTDAAWEASRKHWPEWDRKFSESLIQAIDAASRERS